MTYPSWEEVKYKPNPKRKNCFIYENRMNMFNKQGNWKVTNSSQQVVCQGTTKNMGMFVSHLTHQYNTNKSYKNIDRNNPIHIYFQETITKPIN